jgi:hypothetical protein
MQKKTKQINQKQGHAVQKLRRKSNTETPQKKIGNAKTPRAKFACNPKLAELIEKANLLMYELDMDLGTCLWHLHINAGRDLVLYQKQRKEYEKRLKRKDATSKLAVEAQALDNLPAEVKLYVKQRLVEFEPQILKEAQENANPPDTVNEETIYFRTVMYSMAIVKELYLLRKVFLRLEDIIIHREFRKRNKSHFPSEFSSLFDDKFYEPNLDFWRDYIHGIPLANIDIITIQHRNAGDIIGIKQV